MSIDRELTLMELALQQQNRQLAVEIPSEYDLVLVDGSRDQEGRAGVDMVIYNREGDLLTTLCQPIQAADPFSGGGRRSAPGNTMVQAQQTTTKLGRGSNCHGQSSIVEGNPIRRPSRYPIVKGCENGVKHRRGDATIAREIEN
jgi:hypothetical protein